MTNGDWRTWKIKKWKVGFWNLRKKIFIFGHQLQSLKTIELCFNQDRYSWSSKLPIKYIIFHQKKILNILFKKKKGIGKESFDFDVVA